MIRKQFLYMNDIKAAIESIIMFTEGMSFQEFMADDRTFSAVIRKLEIIGEHTNGMQMKPGHSRYRISHDEKT